MGGESMMPGDQADEIGAPELCPHCRQVIQNLSEKDHVTDRDSERAAVQLSRQCCQWKGCQR
jgi:hypothetical protein